MCRNDLVCIHLFRISFCLAGFSFTPHPLSLHHFHYPTSYMHVTVVYQDLLAFEVGYLVKKRICSNLAIAELEVFTRFDPNLFDPLDVLQFGITLIGALFCSYQTAEVGSN